MMYFDTAYIAKCYLNEPNAEKVRTLARRSPGLGSCEWSRVEFASVLHRQLREGKLKAGNLRQVFNQFLADERAGVWSWFPVTSELLNSTAERLVALPKSLPIRAADALHLTCARENGLDEIYSNDQRLLACAPLFGLKPINVI
jgi:predicted nucleic acid-binding protein